MRFLRPDRRGFSIRSVVFGVAFGCVASAPAALPADFSTASAALLYVLAVVAASIVGGLWACLACSVTSFLALNFFFTPPLHTLQVSKGEDLVALLVFLLVSVVVGMLVSVATTQRERAERRERETRLVNSVGTGLLSGRPAEDVVREFARGVSERFGLTRVEVQTELLTHPVAAPSGDGRAGLEGSVRVPIIVRNHEIGHVLAVPRADDVPLDADVVAVIRTLAGQLGLVLESARLAQEATAARLESETNELRAALFSSVTHDLRTPLASITASVTSLLDGEATFSVEDRRDLLETIHHEAERLNRLVGNLLDLSRMRAGALSPAKAPASMDELVEGVVGRLASLLEDHDVRLMIRNDLPPVPMDVVQVDQVLSNLLENAAKFSPPGSRISVTVARWHDTIDVRVADQGPGIPLEDRQRVFEPFVRGSEGNGSGLGLAIARAIVESHGGRIWIDSAPAGGASVGFSLPLP